MVLMYLKRLSMEQFVEIITIKSLHSVFTSTVVKTDHRMKPRSAKPTVSTRQHRAGRQEDRQGSSPCSEELPAKDRSSPARLSRPRPSEDTIIQYSFVKFNNILVVPDIVTH